MTVLATADATRLVLPRLTRAEAAWSRARFAPRAALELLNSPLRLRLSGKPAEPPPTAVRIDVAWGEDVLAVWCPAGLPTQILHALNPDLEFTTLPADLAAFLLEAALLAAIAAWEEACGRGVSVQRVDRELRKPSANAVPLMLEDGPVHWPLLVSPLLPEREQVVDALLQSWPIMPAAMEGLPLPAALRVGLTWLSAAAVASLRPGDAVLLQTARANGPMLVIAEAWVMAVQMAAGGPPIIEALAPQMGLRGGEWTMRDPMGAQGHVDASLPGDPDELPIRLAFDIGALELTLGELRRLGPGTVLDLIHAAPELVRISAHGRLIGYGELVDVEGRVGVRITRFFNHD